MEKEEDEQEASVSQYSCKQHFALNFFQCWSVHQQSARFQHKWIVCAQVIHFNNFQVTISEYKGVLHCEGYDYEEIPDESTEAPLSQPFFHKENENA